MFHLFQKRYINIIDILKQLLTARQNTVKTINKNYQKQINRKVVLHEPSKQLQNKCSTGLCLML